MRLIVCRFLMLAVFCGASCGRYLLAADSSVMVEFSRDIKPIISNACYRCHGPDPAERKGGTDGLRLDTAEGVFADLGGHAAVVAGKPDASELIKRISATDSDEIMPPKGTGKPLTPHEIDLISRWIKQGAKFSQHWSYVKPVRPQPPAVSDASWIKNEIDRFILARLEREGLKPSPEADREALVRRVTIDLTGLPPTLEEVHEFLNDREPKAYERLVDRVLAKQSYGEHWGLLWLDLARYADSAGYADDPARKIWLYRDYVIKSFNANKPFDQFTLEQIAGDLLPNPTDDQLIATAFHRNTMLNEEGGIDPQEFRFYAMVDRTNTTATTWLGLTLGCAQCHTHKYDPITQEDYFRFFAFFNNTEDADRGDESPLHSIFTSEQQQQRSALQSQIAKLEPVLKTVTPELSAAQSRWDTAFPRTLAWQSLIPSRVESKANITTAIAEDGSVKVAAGANTDTYTIDIPGSLSRRLFVHLDHDRLPLLDLTAADVVRELKEQKVLLFAERIGIPADKTLPDFQLVINTADLLHPEQLLDLKITNKNGLQTPLSAVARMETVEVPLRAIRLEALPDESLPGRGPGHAGGNFVITKMTATVNPPAGAALRGRYVRVDLPGEKYLSLAEVQIFAGTDNVAMKGVASQVSTDFGGDAKRAIDGNTDGRYFEANSTTHTAAGKDPWWEVDLQSDQAIDRIAVWNRADGVGDRLANFRLSILNDRRESVWQTSVSASPNPSSEFPISNVRAVTFDSALADYAQSNFDPANVLNNKDPKTKGWAIGGATGKPHSLTLISQQPIKIAADSVLKVMIEQESNFANHTLGHFRLSVTDDAGVAGWARTPAAVIAALQIPAGERTTPQQELLTQHYLMIAPELAETRQQLASLQKSIGEIKPETVPIMKELAANRRITKLQHRGNFEDLGQVVSEGTPAAFFLLLSDAPRNRLTLAKWLIDTNNPLTARVIANRYWEQLFGIGIVASSEDFGSQGDLPYHPELLDWLACELAGIPRETQNAPSESPAPWDSKAFLKTLVTSAAYRQASNVSPEFQQRDPDNRLLARGPRFRLSAETLRDQALFVSGLLSSKMFGPPVKPPQPNLGLSAAFGSSTDWQTSMGEDKYRRGVYTTWRRSNPYPSMATFDAPNREVCTVRRVRTNTPLQALVTLNDPVNIEAAQALARRIAKDGGATTESRASYGFQLVLARSPHEGELNRLAILYEKSLARFTQNAEDAVRVATDPLGAAPPDANVAELAAWTVVGNVLLNLDETVMKR